MNHFSQRFSVESLDVRGCITSMGDAITKIVNDHKYPAPVAKLLGEAITLAAMLSDLIGPDNRVQLQTKTDGAVPMLVVDITAAGEIRGYANIDQKRLSLYGANPSPKALLGIGHMGITIEPAQSSNRYQGLVTLEHSTLEDAAHQYFMQSEQIPTKIKLHCAPHPTQADAWQAKGVMVQSLPEPSKDLDPESFAARRREQMVEDHWREAEARLASLTPQELFEEGLTLQDLLLRLFYEHEVRVFDVRDLLATCRCSEDKILEMLGSFDIATLGEMVEPDGALHITCEFCSHKYVVPLAHLSANSATESLS